MNVLVFVQFSALLIFSAVLAGLDQMWTTQNIPALWYLKSLNRWPELPPGGLGWLVSVSMRLWGHGYRHTGQQWPPYVNVDSIRGP